MTFFFYNIPGLLQGPFFYMVPHCLPYDPGPLAFPPARKLAQAVLILFLQRLQAKDISCKDMQVQ